MSKWCALQRRKAEETGQGKNEELDLGQDRTSKCHCHTCQGFRQFLERENSELTKCNLVCWVYLRKWGVFNQDPYCCLLKVEVQIQRRIYGPGSFRGAFVPAVGRQVSTPTADRAGFKHSVCPPGTRRASGLAPLLLLVVTDTVGLLSV